MWGRMGSVPLTGRRVGPTDFTFGITFGVTFGVRGGKRKQSAIPSPGAEVNSQWDDRLALGEVCVCVCVRSV